jgi:hypothetical protein
MRRQLGKRVCQAALIAYPEASVSPHCTHGHDLQHAYFQIRLPQVTACSIAIINSGASAITKLI